MHAPTKAADRVEDATRNRLIEAAISLYGARGTQAVSLREITRHADVLNNGAIKYYFGNRDGLLEAAMVDIHTQLMARVSEAQSALHSIASPTLRDVVQWLVGGVVDYYFNGPLAENAIRLLSRLITEDGESGQRLLVRHFGHLIGGFEDLIRPLLPNKSPTRLRIHLLLCIDHVLSALPHTDFIYLLADAEDPTLRLTITPEQHLEAFVDYLTSALQAD